MLGCCRVASSLFVVHMSGTSCWRVRFWWCSPAIGVAFHAARLCCLAHGGGKWWCIGAAHDVLEGPVILVTGAVAVFEWEPQRAWEGVVGHGGSGWG